MRKIRIAQIGVGHDHAEAIFESLLRQSDIFDVAGYCVCEGEEEIYEAHKNGVYGKAKRLQLEEILNDPELEAVAVECCEVILTKYARMAAEKGYHIHMDKPGSEDPEEFAKLACTAKAGKLVFHLGYMYRYNPAVIRSLELVKSGKLGKIYSVEAHMDIFHSESKRQWMETFKGGMMFYLGCHLVDLIVQLQGIPEEVIPLNMSTGIDGVTAEDYGMAVFRYKNGISFAKTCGAEIGGYRRRQLVICGELGTIEIKPLERLLCHYDDHLNHVVNMGEVYKDEALAGGVNTPPEIKEMGPYNRYDPMMAGFAAMVRGEKENPWSYEYEILLHRILLKACGFEIDYTKGEVC